jgi:hypothetical protein
LLSRASWGNASLSSFYLHLWLCSTLLFVSIRYLRRCRVLRPVTARTWSPDLVIFQLVRWPVVAWGFVHGMWLGWRRRSSPPRVTPKGTRATEPLKPSFVVPLFALGLIPLAAAALASHTPGSIGFLSIAITQGAVYIGAGLAVVTLHLRAARRPVPVADVPMPSPVAELVVNVAIPNLSDCRTVLPQPSRESPWDLLLAEIRASAADDLAACRRIPSTSRMAPADIRAKAS